MSRRNKNANAANTGGNQSGSVQAPGGPGGGGSRIPIQGQLNIQLGPKGVTVGGKNIQPVTVPLHRMVSQNPNQAQGNWQGAGGGQAVIQGCILAATSLAQIAQQQFALGQQAQAANQQLLTALTQLGQAMGMQPIQTGRKYRAPQTQYAGQQNQARKQKAQRQQQQTQAQETPVFQFA